LRSVTSDDAKSVQLRAGCFIGMKIETSSASLAVDQAMLGAILRPQGERLAAKIQFLIAGAAIDAVAHNDLIARGRLIERRLDRGIVVRHIICSRKAGGRNDQKCNNQKTRCQYPIHSKPHADIAGVILKVEQ